MTQTVTFWYGCNVVRHGDIIRGSIALLEAIGVEVRAAGGAAYCCGTAKDANLRAAAGMAQRTVEKFNTLGHDVVTWCPSCHLHMDNFMQHQAAPRFEVAHLTQVLHRHRDRLAARLLKPVPRRVLVHRHLGFRDVPVAPLVEDLLALVPELEIVTTDYAAPGHMCSAIARVPEAHAEVNRRTIALAHEHRVDDVVTLFHSCQRLLCGFAATEPFGITNYVTLLARSMGIELADRYTAWKAAPDDDGLLDRIGRDQVREAGEAFVRAEILPELRGRPRR